MATKSFAPILVVDDDAASRKLVRLLLLHEGYEVVEAGDGREGLGVLISHKPEPALVILDLEMPVMSGREFLAIIANYRRLSMIPVLVTSADWDAAQSISHGAVVGFVSKPIDASKLLAVVEELLVASSTAKMP